MRILNRLLGVLLLFTFTFDASAQTIAEIARRERARQQQVENQSKGAVFTNATAVGGVPSTPRPVQPATAQSSTAPKPTGPVDNKGRDEKYWRQVFLDARNAAKRADEIVQILEATVRDLNTQFLRQSDIYNRENVLGPKLTAAQKDLDAARREAEQARNRISQLEDELRAAGGLPGWAR